MSRGAQRSMAALADEGIAWVALGTVTAVEAHDNLGYLLTITLQPTGREVQAQLTGRRFLLSVEVGDAVLVLFPDGDPNRAVAFPAELVSSAAPLPSSWTNGGPQIVDADGLEVRQSQTDTVQKLVTEDILSPLAGMAGEVVQIGAALAAFGVTIPTTNSATLAAMGPTQYRTAALRSK